MDIDLELVRSLLGNLKCADGMKCANSGMEELCKAEDIGLENFLICLEENPGCTFRFPFGRRYFCKCPVRIYIGKELRK